MFPAVFLLVVILFSFTRKNFKGTIPGKQISYTYHSESLAYSDISQLYNIDSSNNNTNFFSKPGLQSMRGTISCTIIKTILTPGKDSQLIVFQISRPEINITQNGLNLDTGLIKIEICKPVFIHQGKYGDFGIVFTDSSISAVSASLVKDIISRFQFVTSANNTAQWETKELNPAGSYTADYRLAERKNGRFTYIKNNKGYDKGHVNQSNQRLSVESYSVITTDSLNTIQQEDISESLVTLIGKDTLSLSGNKTTIRQSSVRPVDRISLLKYYQVFSNPEYKRSSSLSMQLSNEEIINSAYTNTLGNDTWNSLQQKLSLMISPSKEETEQLVMKLRALATLQPLACHQIVNRLSKENFGTAIYEILSNAIGRTGSSNASDGLAQIIWERQNEKDVVMDLLPLLAIHPNPSYKAISIVKKLGFEYKNDADITSTAQLALGGIAFNIRKSEPLQSDNITNYILQKINQEKDTLQKLLILGNTGNSLILPQVLPLIKTKNVSKEIKIRAIAALRFINQNEITSLLESLSHSDDSLIRNISVDVFAFRNDFLK